MVENTCLAGLGIYKSNQSTRRKSGTRPDAIIGVQLSGYVGRLSVGHEAASESLFDVYTDSCKHGLEIELHCPLAAEFNALGRPQRCGPAAMQTARLRHQGFDRWIGVLREAIVSTFIDHRR